MGNLHIFMMIDDERFLLKSKQIDINDGLKTEDVEN